MGIRHADGESISVMGTQARTHARTHSTDRSFALVIGSSPLSPPFRHFFAVVLAAVACAAVQASGAMGERDEMRRWPVSADARPRDSTCA